MNLTEKTILTRTRERLAETRSAVINSTALGITHVIQHKDTGALLSGKTGYWTFDLNAAYAVSADTPSLLGGNIVPVHEARDVLLAKLREAAYEVEQKLNVG